VSPEVAQGLIAAIFNTFPGLQQFVHQTKERARRARLISLPSGRGPSLHRAPSYTCMPLSRLNRIPRVGLYPCL